MAELRNVTVLIPAHSLEDLPSEFTEEEAAGILNAFAICRHPALVHHVRSAAEWGRADEPPHHLEAHLFIVPSCCEGWMPHEWTEHARSNGATVIENCTTREEYAQQLLQLLPDFPELTPDLTQDFYALGTAWLLIEILTRKMHYYSSMDEHVFQKDLLAAADAAVAGDTTAAQTHLKGCFETLLECREHFYPVDCYLIDLCLLHPDMIDEHFEATLNGELPINFLLKGDHLREIAEQSPAAVANLKNAVDKKLVEVIGGDCYEQPISTASIQSVIWDLQQGKAIYTQHLGKSPTTWARKRFGFSTQLPQILTHYGFHSALHIALDDGLYPDEEQSKFRWEGCDGTVIDAVSRIPLAADGAASYLRFADRMAESMQDDQVAGILFARWPEIKGVWFRDFQRIHSYAPVLGQFVTLDEFILTTDHSGRLSRHQEKSYLSPYLLQAVAYGEPDPVSRFQQSLQRRHLFDRAAWLNQVNEFLRTQTLSPDNTEVSHWKTRIERSGPDLPAEDQTQEMLTPEEKPYSEQLDELDAELADWTENSLREISRVMTAQGENRPGLLVVNTISQDQTAVVELEGFKTPPALSNHVKAVQFDDHRKAAVVDIPGSGFLCLKESEQSNATKSPLPAAEEMTLRNEHFEVLINSESGGIQHLKGYGRSPNRLSQQIAYRYLLEKTYHPDPEDPDHVQRTNYSLSQMTNCEILSSGPALGEIKTECELLDPEDRSVIGLSRNTYRVWKSRPIVEIDIEIEPHIEPEGDPWSCYFTSRFAWKDESIVLTRGLLQGAHGIQGERFEAPYYLELAENDRRTTILMDGLPFHRRSGSRMVDSILIPAGESKRRFRFWIAFDEAYPMQAAHQMLIPPLTLRLDQSPKTDTGWFFRLKQKNVQILGFEPITPAPHQDSDQQSTGLSVRLLETEGRARRVQLQLLMTPQSARKRDAAGNTVADLMIQKNSVILEMRSHELATIDLNFFTDS
ncbi:MAG: hypothetical protein HUJ26_24550 [Planctomycetaceae bacterium]|nr:hypothetical protein [Planctomycetaceae bacterium]